MRATILLIITSCLLWSCHWAPEELDVNSLSTYKQLEIIRGLTSEVDVVGYDFHVLEYPDPGIVTFTSHESGHFELMGRSPGVTLLSISYFVDQEGRQGLQSVMYISVEVSDGIPVNVHIADTLLVDMSQYVDLAVLSVTDSMDIEYLGGTPSPPASANLVPGTFKMELYGINPGEDSLLVNFYDATDSVILALPFEIESSIKKVALVELFTNSGCINCPEANHYLDNIYSEFSDDMTLVRYHVNWTDPEDPMNLYNPDDVLDRVEYYNVFTAPGFVLDGNMINTIDENDWINRIGAASRESTPIYISPVDLVTTMDSLFLSFDLESYSVVLSDLDVWSMVLEDSIYYPGTNGEEIHMQVMRDMTFSQVSGDLAGFRVNHSLKKPEGFVTGDLFSFLVFIQDRSSKQVIQSRKQHLD